MHSFSQSGKSFLYYVIYSFVKIEYMGTNTFTHTHIHTVVDFAHTRIHTRLDIAQSLTDLYSTLHKQQVHKLKNSLQLCPVKAQEESILP